MYVLSAILLIFHLLQLNDQVKWEQVHVDDNLTVTLPGEISQTDTLKQTIIIGDLGHAVFTLQRVPASATPVDDFSVHSLESLEAFYDGMQGPLLSEESAVLIHMDQQFIDGMQARRLSVAVGEDETHDYLLLLVNNVVYTASVVCFNEDAPEVEPLAFEFFNSFDFQSTQQYEATHTVAYQLGHYLVEGIFYLGLPLVVLIVFILIRRKRKAQS